MRKELLWAVLWLLAGIGISLAAGRSVTGQAAEAPASSSPAPATGAGHALPASGAAPGAAAPEVGSMVPRGIGRYAGLWYDIAATPDRFHEGCRRDATTRYTLRPDASLQVENLCRAEGGDLRDAEGVLRILQPGNVPSRLQLRYAPDWMAWLPLAWSEVEVIDFDPGYRHVAMATPDRKHLWVLSRAPAMAEAEYEALLARARAQGVDTERLRRIPQEGADRREEGEALP